MELIAVKELNNTRHIAEAIPEIVDAMDIISTSQPFIEANTVECSLAEVKQHHIIPVWVKDNEPVISHAEFIESTFDIVRDIFHSETVFKPSIRLSHPIKGRIPEAKNKAAKELLEHEKTLYYERMAFVIEVPTIHTDIGGNKLNLTVGGIKAYNLDNLYNKSGADQHFKLFIGFKNAVCTNLCVSTDGYQSSMKVKNQQMLQDGIKMLLQNFNAVKLADNLKAFSQYDLTEQQFAQLIGRCKMHRYLPDNLKIEVPELMFGESQLNSICHDYYNNNNFCRGEDGKINLWRLYNLFTGANKSSYIDTFLDRSVNAFQLVQEIQSAIQHKTDCWYLN